MLGSPLLGTAVGLVVLFATTALLCSAITESIANLLQMRGRYLLTGMRAMLDADENGQVAEGEPAFTAFTAKVRTFMALLRKPHTLIGKVRGARKAREAKAREVRRQAGAESGRAAPTAVAEPRVPTVNQKGSLRGECMNPVLTRRAAEQLRGTGYGASREETPSPTTALFESPLLRSLESKRIFPFHWLPLRTPQYVSAQAFARALVDLLVVDPKAPAAADYGLDEIKSKVEHLPQNLALRRELLAMLGLSGDLDTFVRAVEQWYDEQMAKINGWYKRWARVVLGVVGLVVAIVVNLDTIQVARTLYVDAPVRQAVVASADAGSLCQGTAAGPERADCVQKELETLGAAGLPVGYPAGCDLYPLDAAASCWPTQVGADPLWTWFLRLFGWAITAFAVSFGAPFWFEALSRLGSLRSAGTPPARS
jgi:hypothetical protein